MSFWFETPSNQALLNAIKALGAQVAALKTQLTQVGAKLMAAIDDLNTVVTAEASTLADLSTDIGTLETDIAAALANMPASLDPQIQAVVAKIQASVASMGSLKAGVDASIATLQGAVVPPVTPPTP